MKKNIMFFGSIAITFLMVSTITASIAYADRFLKNSNASQLEKATDISMVTFQTELVIDGPTNLSEGQYLEYTFYLIEPGEYDILLLSVDWGDHWITNWHGPFNSSHIFHLFHDWWKGAGVYTIKASVITTDGEKYDAELTVTVENLQPGKPTITGRANGIPRTYKYTFVSKDPGGNDVSYYIKWGDGQITNWTDFQWSGLEYSEYHKWSPGTFTIEAKAKDIHGAESDWARLTVTMPLDLPNQQQSTPQSQPSDQPQTAQLIFNLQLVLLHY